jgi:hypothetical protein
LLEVPTYDVLVPAVLAAGTGLALAVELKRLNGRAAALVRGR